MQKWPVLLVLLMSLLIFLQIYLKTYYLPAKTISQFLTFHFEEPRCSYGSYGHVSGKTQCCLQLDGDHVSGREGRHAGAPHIFLCELKPHAKFRNPMRRKVTRPREREERKIMPLTVDT